MVTIYDFAVGQTNPETFPAEALEALKGSARRAIDVESAEMNRYSGAKGHLGLRELMASRESEREGLRSIPRIWRA